MPLMSSYAVPVEASKHVSEHKVPMRELINKHDVAKAFSAAAHEYDDFAQIQHRMAMELISEMPDRPFDSILDLGCGTGYCLPELQKRYPKAHVQGMDLAEGMLQHARKMYPQFQYFAGDAEAIPVDDQQYDLIYSSFAIQWCEDLSNVLMEVYRTLKPGGCFAFTTLADGTLRELKQAWKSADNYQHVNQFLSANDIESQLAQSSFLVAKSYLHTEIQWYDDVRDLTDSLKRVGAHNMTSGRAKGLTSTKAIKTFRQSLEQFRTEQGLPARYEVLTAILFRGPEATP